MFVSLLEVPVAGDLIANSNFVDEIGPNVLPDGIQAIIGVMAGVMIVFAILSILVTIIWYLNIYSWGMADKAAFERAGQDKKKWFKIFFILPLIASVVNIIPILGQIASLILFIYYLVMILVYFFKVRKQLSGGAPASPIAKKPV